MTLCFVVITCSSANSVQVTKIVFQKRYLQGRCCVINVNIKTCVIHGTSHVIFWVMTPCSDNMMGYQRFGRPHCLCLQLS